MDFNEFIDSGIKKVYSADMSSQQHYVGVICSEIRKIDPSIIFKFSGVFIPNENYVDLFFGEESHREEFGMYNSFGQCMWQNYLIFPVYDVNDRIAGLVGYNPIKHLEAEETSNYLINHYSYSLKKVFRKGDYLFCLKGTFMQAYRSGYLVIVDGVFDAISLAEAGFLAAALLGSTISDVVAAQLRLIDRIIVATDNDDAGLELYRKLKRIHKNAVFVKQGIKKDADDVLKTEYRDQYLAMLREAIDSSIPLNYSMGRLHLF